MNIVIFSRLGAPCFTYSLIALLFSVINTYCQTNVYFTPGSDHIDAKGKEILKEIAANVAGKNVSLIVTGSTDTTGNPHKNYLLARRREAAVSKILIENGFDPGQIGYICNSNLSDSKLSDIENRRVSITIQELVSYTAKNGSIIMAPKNLRLKLINQFYQPDLVQNYYRNKSCMLPMRPGWWLTDVAIESKIDSCNFIIVKIPERDEDYLPALFLGKVKYENHGKISFGKYGTTGQYKLFRVPLYSDYIALDQHIWCGYTPTVYLNIVLPRAIRPTNSKLADDCVTLRVTSRKDTLRTEFHEYAWVNWKGLKLSVRTRDTLYQVPMSAFDIIYESDYGAGYFIVKLPEDRIDNYFPEKRAPIKKRRTFWQRLRDLFN